MTLKEIIAKNTITMTAVFVPFSQSRNKHESWPSLNWIVTVKVRGRDIWTGDYMQGSVHCPANKHPKLKRSQFRRQAIAFECESGKAATALHENLGAWGTSGPIPLTLEDVLHCLALDAHVLNNGSFSDWASDFGYSADSIAARGIYDECLKTALSLRAGLGNDTLEELMSVEY